MKMPFVTAEGWEELRIASRSDRPVTAFIVSRLKKSPVIRTWLRNLGALLGIIVISVASSKNEGRVIPLISTSFDRIRTINVGFNMFVHCHSQYA